jgi:tetratricopeptide (TPR) repeat protein
MGMKKPRDLITGLEERVTELLRTDAAQALDLAHEACDAASRLSDPIATARARRALAHACHALGRFPEAVDAYETALGGFVDGKQALDANRVRVSMIDALMYVKRFGEALDLADAARRGLRGKEHAVLRARLAWNEGNVCHRMDLYDDALKCYGRARRIFATREGGARAVAMLDLNRAVVLTAMNEPERALRLFRRSRRTFEAEGLTALRLQLDYNLAWLHFFRGRMTEALNLLDRVREEFEDIGDRRHVALCDLDRSEILLRLNLFREAGELARRSSAAFNELGLAFEEGKALVNAAIARGQFGDRDGAARDLDAAARLFTEEESEVWAANARLGHAEMLLASGRPDLAAEVALATGEVFVVRKLWDRAAQADLVLGRAAAATGDDESAARFLDTALARGNGRTLPWVKVAVRRERGRIFLRGGDREKARREIEAAATLVETLRSGIADREQRATFLDDKQRIYEDLVEICLDEGDVESALSVVERSKSPLSPAPKFPRDLPADVRKRIEGLRGDLSFLYTKANEFEGRGDERSLRHAAALRGAVTGFEEELGRITDRHAVADACVAPTAVNVKALSDEATTILEYFVSDGMIHIFVVRPDGVLMAEATTPADEVRALADRFFFQVAKTGFGEGYCRAHSDQLACAADVLLGRLHGALLEPVADLITGNLVVVPHGFLHAVPFHALRGPDGPVIAHREVTVSPSATLLSECRTRTAEASGPPLLVGVPDRNAPRIAEEIEGIRQVVGRSKVLVGRKATRAAVLRHLKTARVAHIATHGVFREDNPDYSAIRLADRWLSLGEIRGMEIGAKLVVLSACETGRVEVLTGDEIAGVAREFLAAGVPALLASLWRVSDETTMETMKDFHAALRDGASPASAIRSAALSARERQPHPGHWAPFVLFGEGRRPVVSSTCEKRGGRARGVGNV